jgi:hypothetical protein
MKDDELPELTSEMWSLAFKAFKEGKEPIDLVIEGILDPDSAKYAYEKYIEMTKSFKIVRKPELNNDSWKLAFKAFREGKKPMDLVLEGLMSPEDANYAYEKFQELVNFTKGVKGENKEIPNLLMATFMVGAGLVFIESWLLRHFDVYDPVFDYLSVKLDRSVAIIVNNVLAVFVLILLIMISTYLIKDEKLSVIPPAMFCVFKIVAILTAFV